MELKLLPVARLELDPQNPRLPEEQQGGTPEAILSYLEQNDVLTELAASFVANGYFENEPLVVLQPSKEGNYCVVEGNRRLATLSILQQTEAAKRAGLSFDLNPPASDDVLEALKHVPCYVTDNRSDVAAFLGYRHISGLRRWSAEAKARYIWRSVNDSAATNPNVDPFYTIGRLVGSNARGVRSAYLAFELLRSAKADYDVDTRYVLTERFGVWTRLLGTAHVLSHIGVPETAKTFSEIQTAMTDISGPRVKAVVKDLTPQGDRDPVLNDSRDVTVYSRILADDAARETLRAHHDFETARLLVEQSDLAERVRKLIRSCDLLATDARRMEISEEAADAASELAQAAESVENAFKRSRRRQNQATDA